MKKIPVFAACLLLAFSLSAPANALVDGSYTAQAPGFSETLPITLSLTLEGGVITAASATGEGEHPGYAEEALRESDELQRAIIGASPLAIISIDLERRVRSWNAAADNLGLRHQKTFYSFGLLPPAIKPEAGLVARRVSRLLPSNGTSLFTMKSTQDTWKWLRVLCG